MWTKLLFFIRKPYLIPVSLLMKLGFFDFIKSTNNYQNPNTFEMWFCQKVLNIGGNREAYWPVHYTSTVYNPKNIVIGVDCSPGLMKNCYIQGSGGVAVGDYTQIASNVSIVSDNHNPYDCREHSYSSVKIGKYCWIGVGATILAGVELGDFTIVAAGAVVTKSFTDGHCIIAGVPAKKIKDLEVNNCVRYEASTKYYGYLDERKFKRRFA